MEQPTGGGPQSQTPQREAISQIRELFWGLVSTVAFAIYASIVTLLVYGEWTVLGWLRDNGVPDWQVVILQVIGSVLIIASGIGFGLRTLWREVLKFRRETTEKLFDD